MESNPCGKARHLSKHCAPSWFALSFSFTSQMSMVVSSKDEKHVNKVGFVADCWAFYFYDFALKTKSIPCINEVYTTVLFSFFLDLQLFFHKHNKHRERPSCFGRKRGGERGLNDQYIFF